VNNFDYSNHYFHRSVSYEQSDRLVTDPSDEEFNRSCGSDKNVSEEAETDLEIQELVMTESISDELESNASISEVVNKKFLENNELKHNDKRNDSIDNKCDNKEPDTVEAIRQWALLDPLIPHTRFELLLNILIYTDPFI